MFKLTVVGRANADLVLNGYSAEIVNRAVVLKKAGKEYVIRTDETPSEKNDKVNAVESLDRIVGQMKGEEDYIFTWGGGGVKSAKTAATSSVLRQDMRVNFLTTVRPDLFIGSDRKDLKGYLDRHEISSHFMCSSEMGYNLIIGKEKQKIVIRNPSKKRSSALTDEDKGIMRLFVEQSDGILINALNDRTITAELVQYAFNRNQYFRQNPAQVGPRLNKIMTVITPALLASEDIGEAKNFLLEEIVPYAGIIINEEDLINIFHGPKVKADPEHKLTLETMAKLRYGFSRKLGTKTKVVDPSDHIYVTLGREGYLLGTEDSYYHFRTDEARTKEFDEHLMKNKGSVTGAGDAFAAGAIHQEILSQDSKPINDAAIINTVIARQLDHIVTIHSDQIVEFSKGNLADHYVE